MSCYFNKKYLILLLFFFLDYTYVFADDRFLTLNPTMHFKMINRIDIDANQTLLATASDDKTVRLWQLPAGHLIRVLRPPADFGNEGKIFAVALSPDGKKLAAGGWTKAGYRGFAHFNIYIFDTNNGQITSYLAGIEDAILHLDFSPDGNYLAATIAGQEGVRIWDLSNMVEVFRDDDYTANNYWLEFSPNGKYLVTTCYDGHIRLYGDRANPKLLHDYKIKDHNTPFSVRFSPDSQKLAVGFTKSPHVAVLPRDLSSNYLTTSYEKGFGDLFATTWSSDGQVLYGAGEYKKNGKYSILKWNQQGKAKPVDWQVAWNTIIAMQSLSDNKLLYASTAPSLGLLNQEGKPLFHFGQETAYLHKNFPDKLLVSPDGQVIQFEHDNLEQQTTFRFSIPEQYLFTPQLDEEIPINTDMAVEELQRYLIDAGFLTGDVDNTMSKETKAALAAFQKRMNLPVTSELDLDTVMALRAKHQLLFPILKLDDITLNFGRYTKNVKMNGKTLSLTSGDKALSYAFAPHDHSLILGTQFNLYRFDKNGNIIWKMNTSGFVWAVNVTSNGKILVAALSDGTIRWYNLVNGHQLMGLYPHHDGLRWIAWTPQGAYAASAGADSLIGWHVNNKMTQDADFYPLHSLHANYYQPEILSTILVDQLIKKKEYHAAMEGIVTLSSNIKKEVYSSVPEPPKKFPPRFILHSPIYGDTFNENEVTFEYQYRFHSEPTPVTLHVLVDGRPWHIVKPDVSEEDVPVTEGKVVLTLPKHTVKVSFIAENEYGISPPETTLLRWEGETPIIKKPNLFLLTIGISKYENFATLPIVTDDITALKDKWLGSNDYVVEVNQLFDSNYAEIMKGLSWLEESATDQDIVILFLNGYAKNNEQNMENRYDFMPSDAAQNSHVLSTQDFINAFRKIKAKVLLCVDTAYKVKHTESQASMASVGEHANPLALANIDDFVNQLSSPENGVIVLSSTTGLQQLDAEDGLNLFTMALLEGLDGLGDVNNDGKIMSKEFGHYVSRRVAELSRNEQTPILSYPNAIEDFLIKKLW